MLAATYGQEKCIEILLNNNADFHKISFPLIGDTALSLAARFEHADCIRLLKNAEKSEKLNREIMTRTSHKGFFSYFMSTTVADKKLASESRKLNP